MQYHVVAVFGKSLSSSRYGPVYFVRPSRPEICLAFLEHVFLSAALERILVELSVNNPADVSSFNVFVVHRPYS
jgi:hypothetical protein